MIKKIERKSKYLKFVYQTSIPSCVKNSQFCVDTFNKIDQGLYKYCNFNIKKTNTSYAVVFEQTENESIYNIMTSFGLRFKDIMFETIEQLNYFVRNNQHLLSNYVTYFLYRDKKDKKYFIVGVSRIGHKLSIFKESSFFSCWSLICKIRFVFLIKT